MIIAYLLIALVVSAVINGEISNTMVSLVMGIFWPISVIWFIFAWWASKR